MLLNIRHVTRYEYSTEVFLEPHYLHFYPSDRRYLSVKDFNLTVSPGASGQATTVDLYNNTTHQLWFNYLTSNLQLEVKMQVETSANNPFQFLEHPKANLGGDFSYES